MTTEAEEQIRARQENDEEKAFAFIERRAELAEKIHSQAINSLWLGNSNGNALMRSIRPQPRLPVTTARDLLVTGFDESESRLSRHSVDLS
jgi:hypothetical protein